jgi:hypothetical protein
LVRPRFSVDFMIADQAGITHLRLRRVDNGQMPPGKPYPVEGLGKRWRNHPITRIGQLLP